MFWCHEELNAPRRVGLAADQAISFERHDHLMDRGRADAEMALHIGLGRRASEHARVGVDEGQILTCFSVKPWSRRVAPDF